MAFRTFSTRKLMEASDEALTMAAFNADEASSAAISAERLLEDSRSYREWECRHERLMAAVGDLPTVGEQLYTLREQALAQVHRKALFEVLRTGDWTHEERRFVFRQLYGDHGDEFAGILSAHRDFLQAGASHWCLVSIGDRFMHDAVLDSWLAEYERGYNHYIESYVKNVLEQGGLRSDPSGEFRVSQKSDLAEARRQILSVPRVPKRSRTGELLRVATGDTQRLPRLTLGRARFIQTR